MPKQKSSASSATKKKHARKTAAREEQLQARALAEEQAELIEGDGEDGQAAEQAGELDESTADDEKPPAAVQEQPPATIKTAAPAAETPVIIGRNGKKIKDAAGAGTSRGNKEAQEAKKKKKQSKKHAKGQAPPPPRKKQYIPPPKPQKTNVDPVDIYGLGVVGASYERIPADKVVSLRLLNKKDSMSVERGLDEVLAWINQVQQNDEMQEEGLVQIAEILPVWIHHLPRLLSHASRRVRYLTASIHSILLHQGTSDLLSYTVSSFTTPTTLEREDFLSCQLCATFDPDRQVRNLSIANWKALTQLVSPQDYLEEILTSLTDSTLESPAGLSAQEQAKRKLSDEERIALQEEKDRKLNHLTASVEAFSSLLQYATVENVNLFTKVTSSDSFWAFLSSKEMDAPQVRRATWMTLSLLLAHTEGSLLLEDSLSTISRIAPSAAFSERDHQTQNTLWEPLITLFRKYPSIWKRPIKSSESDDGTSSDSDSSSSEEQETDASAPPSRPLKISSTIASFFDMLQIAFYGNAASGYQAAPLLIHSIPEAILPRTALNLETLFSSVWGAYVGGAIDAASTAAFVRCLIDLIRLSTTSDEAASVAGDQLIRLWKYYLHSTAPPTKYLSLSNTNTVQELEKGMVTLSTKYPEVFDLVWSRFADLAKQTVNSGATGAALAIALVQIFRSSAEALSLRSQSLLHECVITASKTSDRKASAAFLLEALKSDGKELLAVHDVQNALDEYMLKLQPEDHQLLTAYFLSRDTSEARTVVWEHVCQSLRLDVSQSGLRPLLPFLEAFNSAVLPAADFSNARLDDLIITHASDMALHDSGYRRALEILLHAPEPLATSDLPGTLLTRLVEFLENQLASLAGQSSHDVPQHKVKSTLSLLSLATATQLYGTVAHYPAFVVVFQWAELAPQVVSLDSDIANQARNIYEKMVTEKGPWSLADLYVMTASRLGELLLERQCQINPVVLSETFFKLCEMPNAQRSDLIMAFLPQELEMERLAEPVLRQQRDSRMAVFDPLVQDHGLEDRATDATEVPNGAEIYRRAVLAWLSVLSENRRFGSHIDWFVCHSVLAREVAGDRLAIISHEDRTRAELQALNALADRVAVYLCSQSTAQAPEDWQSRACAALKDISSSEGDQRSPHRILSRLVGHVMQGSGETYASRTFSAYLAMLLHQSGATLKEKEAWLDLAKTWQTKDTRICVAILASLTGMVAESSRLQRYQGEVSSSLSSVKPNEVIEKGLPQLRVLLALSQVASSDDHLLPANRAIFLLQGFQKWKLFESEETEDEKEDNDEPLDLVAPLILQVCTQLVAAIQDLSGSHWDYLFDLAEYLIGSFSWESPGTYGGLSAACNLMEEMRNRSSLNKNFRSLIRAGLLRTCSLLSPIFAAAPPTSDVTLMLLFTMSRLLSSSESFQGDSSTLFALLNGLSGASLATVCEMCSLTIRKEVDELTMNAELRRSDGSKEEPPLGLPNGVIAVLTRNSANPPTSRNDRLKMLLAWILVCGFFKDTTTTLKTIFTEQVRKTNFVSSALLPTIFQQTSVNDRSRGMDLSGWRVEEFHIANLEDDDEEGLSKLAAYAYYETLRTVPSLVRSEWESIKNKQLSMSIETFTSKAFSPLLIDLELSRVHSEEAKGTLQDEEMSVKILPNVNEVKAVYTVDEQPMEIAIRIPPNFPLSPVEVRDVKRIGVPEATWRAWLLNVQLIISTQTNAARHFEGVEACAICYSVVSVTDRSMPTKRCRTCKQLFHPSCLYKWFATSHGSSCPLCRSLF